MVSYSEFTPLKAPAVQKPAPPLYAGSYLQPDGNFYVCTLCGGSHTAPPSCPDCGETMQKLTVKQTNPSTGKSEDVTINACPYAEM